MYNFSPNCRCRAVLWLTIIVFSLNCGAVLSQPPQGHRHHGRGNHNRDQSSETQFPMQGNSEQQMPDSHRRQNFPFGNNPGQQLLDRIRSNVNNPGQILDRIKSNIGANNNFQLGGQGNFNLGMPIANNFKNIAQNTYNIFNKTLGNLNKFSNGNFGNLNQHRPGGNIGMEKPSTPASVISTSVNPNNGENQNNHQTATSEVTTDNVSHYIDGFPVIQLKSNEIRK